MSVPSLRAVANTATPALLRQPRSIGVTSATVLGGPLGRLLVPLLFASASCSRAELRIDRLAMPAGKRAATVLPVVDWQCHTEAGQMAPVRKGRRPQFRVLF